jgi:heme exporter protein B
LRVVLPFAVVSLIVFPIALGLQVSVVDQIGPAVFWALGVLFGMQVALRQSVADSPERRDLQTLVGLDPAARFVGRVISGSVLTFAFLIALFVAMVLLYGPSLPPGSASSLVLSSFLLAIGLTELGTLAGEVTAGLRNRNALASLIVAPLALPLVIGASQTMEAIVRGESILPWVLLMIATGLALAVAGVALARPLEEGAR